MYHRKAALGAVVAVLAIGASSATVARPNPVQAEGLLKCSIICFEIACSGNEHWTADYAPPAGDGRDGIAHSMCMSGGCDGEHPFCSPSDDFQPQDYAALAVAWETGNVKVIRKLAKKFPATVHMNSEREAIQVRSCDGLVIANLPAGPSLWAAVTAL